MIIILSWHIVIQAVEFEAHGYKKYRKVWHINISRLEACFRLYRERFHVLLFSIKDSIFPMYTYDKKILLKQEN